ncbi:MAG: hypothetical protein HUJ65_07140, partial [Oscillospiraceae bacterium]|nr:hypothetical protein [Oscillospiraceae bacterium]
MKKRIVKTAYSVLLAVLLLVSVFQTAFAIDNSVDLDASGYVTVTLTGGEDKHEPVSGATFTIYRVAGIGRINGELAYVYTDEFEGNGALLRNLDDVTLSEHLAAYAKNKGLNGTTKTSDENGKI